MNNVSQEENPYQLPNIDSAIKLAYHTFVNNPVVCIVNSMLMIAVTLLASMTGIGLIFVPGFYGGFLYAMLKLCRNEQTEIGGFMRNGFQKFGILLGANIVMGLAIFSGYLLLLFPGVYLSVRWFYVNILIVDQNLNFSQAFTKSAAMVKNQTWEVFAMWLILHMIGFVISSTGIGCLITPAIECLLVAAFYHLGTTPHTK